MSDYSRPDVYIENTVSGEKPIQAVSTSVGAFVGITPRGVVGKAIRLKSWTDYIRNFANGLDTPFMKDSHMSNAVYGFFQNGGADCVVVRVSNSASVNAKATVVDAGLIAEAKDTGSWANDVMKIEVKNGAVASTFDVIITMYDTEVERLEGLTNTVGDENYFADIINNTSQFIKVNITANEVLAPTSKPVPFASGDDSLASINDTDYTEGIEAIDYAEGVNLVAVPGITAKVVQDFLIAYADKKGMYAILDSVKGADLTAVETQRKALVGENASIYFPWGKLIDPLSKNARLLKTCPPSGHIMGMMARTDSTRGVYKAPAGEEANLRGFVDLSYTLKKEDIGQLNKQNINCIISKANKGIIVWGARTLSANPKKLYVSDIRYDLMAEKSMYEGTQWAVFEPNDRDLWERLDTSLRSFLDNQWRSGALKGKTPEEAFYVKCDGELNTEENMDKGLIISEVGYAKKKPAEFVVIRIVQKTNN